VGEQLLTAIITAGPGGLGGQADAPAPELCAWIDVMNDSHTELMGRLEVRGDVINKYDPLRGDGQLASG
jgi:hypothetical protein